MSRPLAAAPSRRRAAPTSRRRGSKEPSPFSSLLRPFTGAANLARTAAAFVLRRRRLRIALLALAIALPLLGCGWLWFRESSFVSVQRVQITGVHGPEAQAVDAALVDAAHGMSTLDVSAGALSAAVAPLRVVRAVRIIPSFPHGLRIEVSEQLPVAALTVAGQRTAVAADGVVLGPSLLSGSLPSVVASSAPAPGKRVHGASLLAELTLLGAAPAPLAKHVERVFSGAKGLTVAMRNGLLVYFGDASRPHAKWLSLARVLADSSSAGAAYIDVRLPTHPAAGFPAGVTPPDAGAAPAAGSSEAPASTESTIASLAAGLSSGSATGSPTGTEPASGSASGTTAPTSESAETASQGGQAGAGQASSTSEAESAQANPQTSPTPGG
ncbi:MAG: cell division protein FtsQ/DivIB [Solirubrobacteraceae bacterium]|jgi:cell division protein FtsQ